jgi:uncharacterized protein
MARFQPAEAFQPPNDTLELLPLRFERTGTHYLVSNMVGDFIRLSGDELCRLVDLRIRPGDGLYEKAYTSHLISGVKQSAQKQLLALRLRSRMAFLRETTPPPYFCRDLTLRAFVSLLPSVQTKH